MADKKKSTIGEGARGNLSTPSGGDDSARLDSLIAIAKDQNPRWVQRIFEPLRSIKTKDGYQTHLLSYGEADGKYYVYPEIQEDDEGNLKRYEGKEAMDRAFDKHDYVVFDNESDADYFSNNRYKRMNPSFFGYTEERDKKKETQ